MEKYIKAIVISFPGLLLTFVDDMFDGNMAVLVEFHNFGTETGLRPNVLTDFHRRWMELSTFLQA